MKRGCLLTFYLNEFIIKRLRPPIHSLAGSNYLGASWFESANTFKAPVYTLVNASVFYDQPRYRLALKGYNLLNERYWKSIGTPQNSVNVLVRVTFKW